MECNKAVHMVQIIQRSIIVHDRPSEGDLNGDGITHEDVLPVTGGKVVVECVGVILHHMTRLPAITGDPSNCLVTKVDRSGVGRQQEETAHRADVNAAIDISNAKGLKTWYRCIDDGLHTTGDVLHQIWNEEGLREVVVVDCHFSLSCFTHNRLKPPPVSWVIVVLSNNVGGV